MERAGVGEGLADQLRADHLAVLGSKMKDQLFGDANALGANVRVGSERYRVVGVMRAKGTMIGFDLDDTVYVPAARALELFDRDSLFEIDVLYEETAPVDEVAAGIRRIVFSGPDWAADNLVVALESDSGVATIPEAGSLALVALGLLAAMTVRKRRERSS